MCFSAKNCIFVLKIVQSSITILTFSIYIENLNNFSEYHTWTAIILSFYCGTPEKMFNRMFMVLFFVEWIVMGAVKF